MQRKLPNPVFPHRLAATCVASLLVACGPAGSGDTPADADGFRQWRLPAALREISGLALTPDDRLLAVDDERAVVYELDYRDGQLIKSFAFGEPAVKGDFEGIAVSGGRVWLMTSGGELYAASEGAGGQHVAFSRYSTGHGAYCELEGLAQDIASGTLVLVCKAPHRDSDPLRAFVWRVNGASPEFVAAISLPGRLIAKRAGTKGINPSGAAIDPANGELVVVAARQRALFRTGPAGELVAAMRLPNKDRHRQAEGIEVGPDGIVLIADEGGSGKARLSVYRSLAVE